MKHTRALLSFSLVLALVGFGCSGPRRHGESVKPGINKDFLDPNMEVGKFVERFETESREIYAERAAIVEVISPRSGQRIADIGAGTGLFSFPLAERVGPRGVVYAVDIAEPFVARLRDEASKRGMRQLKAVACTEDDVRLPLNSIDAAFICDTYHHFEYPQETMASLHRALRPGGELIVIDFRRIEGESREWTLQHVRAGQEVVTSEIESAGFKLIDAPTIEGLKENYVLRFRRN